MKVKVKWTDNENEKNITVNLAEIINLHILQSCLRCLLIQTHSKLHFLSYHRVKQIPLELILD